MSELLRVVRLSKAFRVAAFAGSSMGGPSEIQALDGVSLSVFAGEVLGLVGESGSGKTTFARCVLRLTEPSSGQVFFDGREISALGLRQFRRLRAKMQMVFQSPAASLNPRMRARDHVLDPIKLHLSLKGAAAKDRAVELFQRVGLTEGDMDKYPHQLSGGQQQRVGIARALAPNPEFLILDEPSSALDASVRGQILNLLLDLRTELEMTYLLISHDLSTIYYMCDRAAVLYRGQVVEVGGAVELFEQPLHPYTQLLVAAMPHLTDAESRQPLDVSSVTWDQTAQTASREACQFLPRCPVAGPECQRKPELLSVQQGHSVRCWRVA